MPMNEPTLNDWLFIGEYVKDWNATAAMRRAGFYHGLFASKEAARRLAKAPVAREINAIRDQIKGKVQLQVDTITDDIINVLTADPRELFEVVTDSCRHCHGEGHLYQRTQSEYMADQVKANMVSKPFAHLGGFGFNPTHDPHPDCPECHGRGVPREIIKDTRFLSPSAAALFMGGKRGKNGIEINMRSKDAARDAAARWLGMNKETHIIKDANKLNEMSDEQLEKMAKGEG